MNDWDGVERRSPKRLREDLERASAAVERMQAQEKLERVHGTKLEWPRFVSSAAAVARRRWVYGAVAAAVVLLAVVLLASTLPSEKAQTSDPTQDQARLYVLVNTARVDAGLPPLDREPQLEQEAVRWSNVMANDKQLRHRANLRENAPSNAGIMGENVAFNTNVEDAHRRLMASPGHRANVLNRRFGYVGVGVAHDDEGNLWITQVFMEARTATATTGAAPPTTPPAPPTTRRAAAATTTRVC